MRRKVQHWKYNFGTLQQYRHRMAVRTNPLAAPPSILANPLSSMLCTSSPRRSGLSCNNGPRPDSRPTHLRPIL